jgi:hypothetical protein
MIKKLSFWCFDQLGGLPKVGELGNYFFLAKHHQITQENKYEKKSKKKFSFLMLRPTVGGLAKAHLWS